MDRRLLPIFLIVFANIVGAGLIIPITAILLENSYGASAFQAIALQSVFYLAQFIFAPILGRTSDRVGRRPVLILSQVGTVLAFIMLINASQIGAALSGIAAIIGVSGGLLVFYLSRILDGATFGNITTAQAYITDVTPPEKRTAALGLIGAAFGFGFIIGPAVGGVLANINPTLPFIGAAIITGISTLITTFFLPESLPPEQRSTGEKGSRLPLKEILSNPTVRLIVLISFFITLAFSAMQATFVLYADRVAFPDLSALSADSNLERNIGLILGFVGVVSVITQGGLIRPMIKKFGEQKIIIIGLISLIIAFASLSLVSGPLAVTLATAPLAFGQGLNSPSLQSLLTRFGTPKTQGELLGIFQSTNSISLILGPLWGGFAFDLLGPRASYALSVPIMAVALLFAFMLLRHVIPEK